MISHKKMGLFPVCVLYFPLRGFKTRRKICNIGSRERAVASFGVFGCLDKEKFFSHWALGKDLSHVWLDVPSGYYIQRKTCHIVYLRMTDIIYGYSYNSMDD